LPKNIINIALLWFRLRRNGGGGLIASQPLLPCAGGFGDQPAVLMDAFDMLDGFAAEGKGDVE